MDIELMKKENGTVELNGQTLVLMQQAYHSNNPNKPCYEANAITEDNSGDTYRVEWTIANPDALEECDTCNWDSYDIYLHGAYVGGTDK